MSNWNGRISVAVSTVAMPPPVVESTINRRGPSHYGDARQISSRPSHYGDAANDSRTTLSESPLRVNAVHHIRESDLIWSRLAETLQRVLCVAPVILLRGLPATAGFFRRFQADSRAGSARGEKKPAVVMSNTYANLQDFYGSDGTRTRDLRGDRPACCATALRRQRRDSVAPAG